MTNTNLSLPTRLSRKGLAWRVASDIADGMYVNLGVGIPTQVSNYVGERREIMFHSENGLLGVGPTPIDSDPDAGLRNVGFEEVSLRTGGVIIDHTDSFRIVRGGHLDLTVMGAYEVSRHGDLANWVLTDTRFAGIGGSMDLAQGARAVHVAMSHVDRLGRPRIRERCTYPLTSPGTVQRVYTDLAVFDIDTERGLLLLTEYSDQIDLPFLRSVTEPEFSVAIDVRILALSELDAEFVLDANA